MKKFKFFDIYQIIITIFFALGVVGSFISNVLATMYVAINLTYDEFNTPIIPEIPLSYSLVYTFFFLIAILGGTWFFVRLITLKSRRREFVEESVQ